MAAVCRACEDPLVIVLEPESDDEGQTVEDPQNVPDDLELPCGCHFHWQCLLDQSQEIAISLNCPSCQKYLPSNTQGPSVTNPFLHTSSGAAILTRYVNEGGLQDALDILPNITEEAYLAANPDARPARAYHLMCAEGDVQGVVDLLQDANEELAGDVAQLGQLIRYQDPLAGGKSALHLALEKEQEEVVWLLLWIASPVPTDVFPVSARQAAESLQIVRLTNDNAEDIRALRTEAGQTAEDVARSKPARWGALVDAGILRA
ncbi:ring finger-like protein [Colletotrichum incanum]|nr:ring finger-like protein [Colletotrichum incanum]